MKKILISKLVLHRFYCILFTDYFRPLLDELKLLSEFKIKSQWLYFVHLQQIPRKINDHFELSQKQIPHIITPLEKKIGKFSQFSIIFAD